MFTNNPLGRTIPALLVAALCFETAPASAAGRVGAAQDSDSKTVKVVARISNSMEASDLAIMLESYSLKPLVYESDFRVGHKQLHDFYLNSAKVSAGQVGADYAEARHAFLMDLLAVEPGATLFDSQIRDLQENVRLALRKAGEPVMVNKVTFEGTTEKVQLFKESREKALGSIEVVEEGTRPQRVVEDKGSDGPPELLKATGTWYPNSGSSVTGDSNSSERYVLQFMQWNLPTYPSNAGWNATYEHDFFLYNYNNDGTYLTSAATPYPGCFPQANYASTSWPAATSPYLDTRFNWGGCEKNEVAYTIGAAQANAVSKGVMYYTYIRLPKGTVNNDKFKLQAQLGHRSPSWCYTTWCSFSDSIVNLIPAWSDKVPGTQNWTKP